MPNFLVCWRKLIFLFISLVFIYNTPLFEIFIDFIKKKSIFIIYIAIIGGGIIIKICVI